MPYSGFPEFNIDDLTGFDNNTHGSDNFDFGGFNWDLSKVAGPSNPYTGADVWGDLNDYPDFPSPSTAPTSLYPIHRASPEEGYNSLIFQGMPKLPSPQQQAATTLSIHSPFAAPSPVPTLSHGPLSLSPEPHAAPITPTYRSYAQPQVIHNPDDLGFGFPTVAGSSSLPTVHASPPYNPPFGEPWRQFPQSDPFHLNTHPFDLNTDTAPPEAPLPTPVASSSGPRRTRQHAREGRRHDPVKLAKRKADSKKDDWSQTLVRFWTKCDTLYSVRNGQPSGGLAPETALAEIDKLVKEDLKRSPLQNTKAGEGKRSRDVEDYLKGLLKAIRPVDPTPILAGAGSDENHTTAAALSRLADELETRLVAVNQQQALRQSTNTSKPGQKMAGMQMGKHVKKNGSEKARRDWERYYLERMSRLFRAPRQLWSKKDVLSLAVLFLLYGPDAFPHGFVEVRPIAPGL